MGSRTRCVDIFCCKFQLIHGRVIGIKLCSETETELS